MKGTNSLQGRIRTLLVDDSACFRRIMSYGLRSTPGIQLVGLAAGGEEALKLVRRLRPQLVLIDVCMPHMDGLAATRIIRKRHPSVRVAAISVAELAACKAKVLDSGAEWAIYKPDLHRALRTLVQQWDGSANHAGLASDKRGAILTPRREPKRQAREA